MQVTLPKIKKSADRQVVNAAGMVLPQQMKKSALAEEAATHGDFKDARVWNEKGNTHIRSGEYETAILAFKQAIELDRSFGQPYNNLAFAYLMLNRLDESLVHYIRGIELLESDRDKAVSWNGIGFIYRCRKDYHNAMAAYQKADELDPDNANHHENVEYLHTDPSPQNAQIWTELGDMFFKAGAYQEAASAYQQAAAISPNSGACLSNMALSLVLLGKYREAVHYYQKSIPLFEQNKDKAVAWNRLGDVYRKLNEKDHAIAAYQNALKINNESANLLTRARFSLLSNCLTAG